MESNSSAGIQAGITRSRPAATNTQTHFHDFASQQSSPRSTALPSPPDSPDSLSSLPSVTSSFFFSSSAASPHTHSHASDQLSASNAGLIIPSLTLPAALQRPSSYGETLGEVNLLFLGPERSGKTALADFIAECDDVVDVSEWEDFEGGRVLHASSDWIEEHDMHGLEKFEGTKNIRIVELEGFNVSDDPDAIVSSALEQIHAIFSDVQRQTGDTPSSPLLHSLLSSSRSPLFTALVYVTATVFTPLDYSIIAALCSAIPVIPYSSTSSSSAISFDRDSCVSSQLATFRPRTAAALRIGLFRSPQTLDLLRTEAADRYMRWRECEHAVSVMSSPPGKTRSKWDKAQWEASISEDVARRIRACQASSEDSRRKGRETRQPCFSPILDPLHLRSLMMLSLALFSPQRPRQKSLRFTPPAPTKQRWGWGLTLLGVFCAGIGLGLALSGSA